MKKNNIILTFLSILFISLFACVDNKQAQKRADANHGLELYELHCAQCHQSDGNGFAKLYPPLRNADFIKNNPNAMAGIIKNGLQGSIVVNGTDYNLKMPANNKLSDADVQHLIEYINSRFLAKK